MLRQVLIGLHLGELKDRRLGVTAHLAHLIGKAIGLGEVRRLHGAVSHKGAASMLANDQPKALQLLQSQANRGAR